MVIKLIALVFCKLLSIKHAFTRGNFKVKIKKKTKIKKKIVFERVIPYHINKEDQEQWILNPSRTRPIVKIVVISSILHRLESLLM